MMPSKSCCLVNRNNPSPSSMWSTNNTSLHFRRRCLSRSFRSSSGSFRTSVPSIQSKSKTARVAAPRGTVGPRTEEIRSRPIGVEQIVYINSGTSRPVFDLARFRPKDEEFFGYHVMTYLAFFKEGERKGRFFETWSGSLKPPLEIQKQLGAAA